MRVEDRAAVVYDVEFMRARAGGRSLACVIADRGEDGAHRVAVAQVVME